MFIRKILMAVTLLLALTIGVGPLIVPQPASAAYSIIYVDVNNSSGTHNGNSWSTAFDTLQEGLDAASSGNEIWVAQGTYTPSAWPNGGNTTDDRQMHFALNNSMEVYGGFEGTETQRDERDWENNTTILSGDIGTCDDSSDNCYHVFYHPSGTNLDNTAVLDGFTVTTGNANGSDPHDSGGGMLNEFSSSPSLSNCSFSGNFASYSGGGMINYESSSPTLTNCSFSGNSAYQYGGGMVNMGRSSPTLTNCSFSGNSVEHYGGGMWNCAYSLPTLTNCSFSGNSAVHGGGMWNYLHASPTLTNCILWGDSASDSDNEVFNSSNSTPNFYYCDIEGSNGSGMSWDINLGNDGGNNIDVDSLYVDEPDPASAPTAEGDLHIKAGSPCIDSGNNTAVAGVSTDFEGDSRIIDGDEDGTDTVDIGADEFMEEARPVGGEAQPINASIVLAPLLGLLAVTIAGSTIALRRRRYHS